MYFQPNIVLWGPKLGPQNRPRCIFSWIEIGSKPVFEGEPARYAGLFQLLQTTPPKEGAACGVHSGQKGPYH